LRWLSGVDECWTVDLPQEEADEVAALFKARGLGRDFPAVAHAPTLQRAARSAATPRAMFIMFSLKGCEPGPVALNVTDVAAKLESAA